MTSMRTKIFIMIAALFAVGCAPRRVAAQYIGNVSLQTDSSIVMNAVTGATVTPSGSGALKCTPALPANTSCQIPNEGQGVYTVTYTTNSPGSHPIVQLRLEASFDQTNWTPISENATDPNAGIIQAFGYYPAVRLNLVTLSDVPSLTASYAIQSGFGPLSGAYNPAQQVTRPSITNQDATASVSGTSVTTPYANSYGTLVISVLNGPIHSGAVMEVIALDLLAQQTIVGQFAVPTSGVKYIPLPPFATSKVQVLYSTGGAGAGQVFASIVFSPPPLDSGFASANINLNTVTQLKTGAGIFHGLTINTGVATGVVTIKDGTIVAAACSGTTLATVNTATAAPTYLYDLQFSVGLCVTPSGAAGSDLTFTWR